MIQSYKNISELKRSANWLIQNAQDSFESALSTSGGSSSSGMVIAEPKLTLLAQALQRVFKGRGTLHEAVEYAQMFKVYIHEEKDESTNNSSSNHSYNHSNKKKVSTNGSENITYFMTTTDGSRKSESMVKKRIINYWCFSPGLAMEELKKLGE